MDIIQRLRNEPFNKQTESKLQSHPYLKAAQDGTLTLTQRQAFAREQYFIQLSDARSFALLAGHDEEFAPSSLTGVIVPEPIDNDNEVADLFHFLLGGEVYAAPLLLAYAKSVGLGDEDALSLPGRQSGSYQLSSKAQAYPSYWSRLAISGKKKGRAAGAAACAVNFPAWGDMCRRLLEALGGSQDRNYSYTGMEDEHLEFIKFFATPIEGLDQMAASIIEKEGASYEDVVESVRLLQEYEVMFWDGIFEK